MGNIQRGTKILINKLGHAQLIYKTHALTQRLHYYTRIKHTRGVWRPALFTTTFTITTRTYKYIFK